MERKFRFTLHFYMILCHLLNSLIYYKDYSSTIFSNLTL